MVTAELLGHELVLLEPNGRLTAETVHEFRRTLLRWLHSGYRDVIVDLGSVNYMDSAGLGALAHAYTSVVRRGGRLVFVHVAGKNLELLRITKLLTVFEVYDSTAAAQSRFTCEQETSSI